MFQNNLKKFGIFFSPWLRKERTKDSFVLSILAMVKKELITLSNPFLFFQMISMLKEISLNLVPPLVFTPTGLHPPPPLQELTEEQRYCSVRKHSVKKMVRTAGLTVIPVHLQGNLADRQEIKDC